MKQAKNTQTAVKISASLTGEFTVKYPREPIFRPSARTFRIFPHGRHRPY
jgi:hypothetical protein